MILGEMVVEMAVEMAEHDLVVYMCIFSCEYINSDDVYISYHMDTYGMFVSDYLLARVQFHYLD